MSFRKVKGSLYWLVFHCSDKMPEINHKCETIILTHSYRRLCPRLLALFTYTCAWEGHWRLCTWCWRRPEVGQEQCYSRWLEVGQERTREDGRKDLYPDIPFKKEYVPDDLTYLGSHRKGLTTFEQDRRLELNLSHTHLRGHLRSQSPNPNTGFFVLMCRVDRKCPPSLLAPCSWKLGF